MEYLSFFEVILFLNGKEQLKNQGRNDLKTKTGN